MNLTPRRFFDLQSQGALGDITDIYNMYTNDVIKDITNFDGKIIGSTTVDGENIWNTSRK